MKQEKKDYLTYVMSLLGYKKAITAADILCNAILFSYQAVVAFCVREILNGIGLPGSALTRSLPYFAVFLLVTLVRIGAIMACAYLDAKRSYYYRNRTRLNLMELLQGKPDIMAVTGKSSRLFEILDDDVPSATFPPELFVEVAGYFVYTLIAFGMLLAVNWRLTLFIFIPLSVAIYLVQRASQRMQERREANRAAHDEVSGLLADVVGGTLSIKTWGAEAAVMNRCRAVNRERRGAVNREAKFQQRIVVLLQGAVHVGAAVMMLICARLMTGGSFGIGDFSLFIAHLDTLADCVNRIVELYAEAKKGQISYRRMVDLHDDESNRSARSQYGAAPTGSDSQPLVAGRFRHETEQSLRQAGEAAAQQASAAAPQSFQVRGLSYLYDGGNGFRKVSFAVEPGELVAIAGGVGSGKSTLLNVLMGLLPAQEGTLFVGGEALPDWAAAGFFAGAPEKEGFFSADIATNLRLNLAATDEKLSEAMSLAAIEEMAAVAAETQIGGGGDKLSGGQRQRLSLARMLLRDVGIYLIDDCVSALDGHTRHAVLEGLRRRLREGNHSIVIATNQREFLEAANRVIVMENGKVSAQGSYGELAGMESLERIAVGPA